MKIVTTIVVDNGITARHSGELVFDTDKHNILVKTGSINSQAEWASRRAVVAHVVQQIGLSLMELMEHEDHEETNV